MTRTGYDILDEDEQRLDRRLDEFFEDTGENDSFADGGDVGGERLARAHSHGRLFRPPPTSEPRAPGDRKPSTGRFIGHGHTPVTVHRDSRGRFERIDEGHGTGLDDGFEGDILDEYEEDSRVFDAESRSLFGGDG